MRSWTRPDIKDKAKKNIINNYGRTIAVCFIVMFFTAAFTTSTRLVNLNNEGEKISKNVIEVMGVQSTAYAVGKLTNDLRKHNTITPDDLKDIETFEKIIDASFDPNSATVNAVKIVDNLVIGGFDAGVIFLFVGFVLKLIYNIFIGSALLLGQNRFFLENRVYRRTGIDKVFSIFWLRHIIHPAIVMLKKWIYLRLWSLTIIGGPIKRYEYIMVPFILAENPQTPTYAAFMVSREMMRGEKFNTFKLELSFLGWFLLNIVTFGIVGIFYYNAYKNASMAELYMTLRDKGIENGEAYSVFFIDSYLEHDEDFISEHNHVYPYEQYMVSQKELKPLRAERKYSIDTYILFFFIFAVVGWCFEVGMHLVGDGVYVNRGTMHGPWLPIFGIGGLFVLLCMRKYVDKPIQTFFIIMIVCTAMEYIVSFLIEQETGIRWWDYSEYFMNLNGRVCLYGALLFGFGGCGFLYFLAPVIDNFLQKTSRMARILICIALCALFITDLYVSIHNPNMGAGITDYKLN